MIDADWVPGAKEYLKAHHNKCVFFLVTATPQLEIEYILDKLNIKHCFQQVVGSPIGKIEAVRGLLEKYKITPLDSIMLGDSVSDYEAAYSNNIPFILRCTSSDKKLQNKLKCKMVKNFL